MFTKNNPESSTAKMKEPERINPKITAESSPFQMPKHQDNQEQAIGEFKKQETVDKIGVEQIVEVLVEPQYIEELGNRISATPMSP